MKNLVDFINEKQNDKNLIQCVKQIYNGLDDLKSLQKQWEKSDLNIDGFSWYKEKITGALEYKSEEYEVPIILINPKNHWFKDPYITVNDWKEIKRLDIGHNSRLEELGSKFIKEYIEKVIKELDLEQQGYGVNFIVK